MLRFPKAHKGRCKSVLRPTDKTEIIWHPRKDGKALTCRGMEDLCVEECDVAIPRTDIKTNNPNVNTIKSRLQEYEL